MSSIWNSATMQTGSSPFATNSMAPKPGGGAAAKFQSMLQASGKAQPAGQATQPGLSPKASFSTGSAKPMDSSSGSDNSDDTGATITANDFLTLLVTEMQNQDPTAQTDPNEYINQLVQINSLEQLISINQNLTYVLDTASSSTPPASGSSSDGGSGSGGASGESAPPANTKADGAASIGSGANATSAKPIPQSVSTSSKPVVHGNLSVPKKGAAAQTVAHSLDGHPHAGRSRQTGPAIRDIPTH